MSGKQFYVYILTDAGNNVLYKALHEFFLDCQEHGVLFLRGFSFAEAEHFDLVGVTSDLEGRMYQHKHGLTPGFASRYKCTKLLYFENGGDAQGAIEREKQLKGWRRSKKILLIERVNPEWRDLYYDLIK